MIKYPGRQQLRNRCEALEDQLSAAGITPTTEGEFASTRDKTKVEPPVPKLEPPIETLQDGYAAACAEGQESRRAWWDENGGQCLAEIDASSATGAEKIRSKFEAIPSGTERSAFYKANREALIK